MRSALVRVAVLSLVVLSACGSGGGVVGTWILDVDATLAAVLEAQMKAMGNLSAEQKAAMEKALETPEMKEMFRSSIPGASVEITFKSDGTYAGGFGSGPGESGSGKWSASGDVITLSGGSGGPAKFTMKGGVLRAETGDTRAPIVVFKRK